MDDVKAALLGGQRGGEASDACGGAGAVYVR